MPIAGSSPSKYLYYRHRLPIRICHWINVVCLSVLFMSGMGIFNAHPNLYWGKSSYTGRPAILQIGAVEVETPAAAAPAKAAASEDDEAEPVYKGVLTVFGHQFDTTGVLGVSTVAGEEQYRAFPAWLTVPGPYSLALSRSWHFFFAWLFVINGLFYVAYTFFSGHFRRDLKPTSTDLKGIGGDIVDHLKFKHPKGEAARRYNVLQKLAYLTVIFILLPLIILMGMAMSPTLNALLPGWVDLFGGRQSARTIHFIVAWLLFGFVAIHLFEVLISGVWNQIRSMITGYFRIEGERP